MARQLLPPDLVATTRNQLPDALQIAPSPATPQAYPFQDARNQLLDALQIEPAVPILVVFAYLTAVAASSYGAWPGA